MHKHREVLIDLKEKYGGICMPAHLKAYFSGSAMQFIEKLDTSYFVDPMTYIFAQPYKNLLDNKAKLKKSIEKLCTEYGSLCATFKEEERSLESEDFTPPQIQNFCKHVLEYQNSGNKEVKHLYSKYFDVPETEQVSGPEFLVAPYFHFEDTNNSWFDVNKRLIMESLKHKKVEEKLFCVICTKHTTISTESKRKRITNEFNIEGIDGFIIWLDDFSEYSAKESDLENLKQFVIELSHTGKCVINMYGSYYIAILYKFGLTAFGHGPHYGEAKDFVFKMGGGPILPRCYLYKLHKFLTQKEMDDNQSSLKMKGVFSEDEDFEHRSEEECIKRFITSRSIELTDVSHESKDQLIENLRTAHNNYSSIGNINIDFLNRWANVLKS